MRILVDRQAKKVVGRQIARPEWREFLDVYSRAHDGWIGTVEVKTPDQHFAAEYRDKPFRGVCMETHRHGDVIMVLMNNGCAAHLVRNPIAVVAEETTDGLDAGLTISGADGEAARIRFRAAASPELLDGIAS